MTEQEALIYLPLDEENDAQDLYEEKLFELKQFFLSRFPMTKLINARLAKFEKVEMAYRVLGGVVPHFTEKAVKNYPKFDSIHALYKWYNLEKNAARLQLSAANSMGEMKSLLENYVELTRYYASHWKVNLAEGEELTIKRGVEPNPMDIQDALNTLSTHQNLDAEYIFSLPDDNCLKSEAKRLSLWLNFEMNE